MLTSLLDSRSLRLIEGFRFRTSRQYRGAQRGERLSKKKGISIEFADYRNYSDGDDLRHLDWNVFARLDSPVIRTYQDEEDLHVYLLVDLSPSMAFGEPSKLKVASSLGLAMGLIGLAGGDAVHLIPIAPRQAPLPVMRGRGSTVRLNHALDRLVEGGALGGSSPSDAVRRLVHSSAKPGLAIVVSDGLDPELPGALNLLGSRGFEPAMIQVLTSGELNPDLEGDLRLLDAETGAAVEITANRGTLESYMKALDEHNRALEAALVRLRGRYGLLRAEENPGEFIAKVLAKGGWFQ